jgi:hypothetical protein
MFSYIDNNPESVRTGKTVQTDNSDDPVLCRILAEARKEDDDLGEILVLMGWSALPRELVVEIKDDLLAFKRELDGAYSSCDPYVADRRKRVAYWAAMVLNGQCSKETAIRAVKVNRL